MNTETAVVIRNDPGTEHPRTGHQGWYVSPVGIRCQTPSGNHVGFWSKVVWKKDGAHATCAVCGARFNDFNERRQA